MANLGFDNCWNAIVQILFRKQLGDKFIYEAIEKEKGILRGEQSGHMLQKINNFHVIVY